jgi:hypothetical protein
MNTDIKVGTIYTHYKGGRYYVLAVAEETTNARIGGHGIVYVSLTYGKLKYRDLDEFCEEIEWPDGVRRPRFVPEEGA